VFELSRSLTYTCIDGTGFRVALPFRPAGLYVLLLFLSLLRAALVWTRVAYHDKINQAFGKFGKDLPIQ